MRHEITIRYERQLDPSEVRIGLLRDGREWLRCFVRSSGPPLRPTGDALLCFGLLPALELGCDLRIESPVDRGLLASAWDVQTLVAGWTPGCRPVAVTAQAVDTVYPEGRGPERRGPERRGPKGRGHGVFFSGGVDSSYSLAVNKAVLDGLVTVIGCDVSVTDRPRADWLAGIARRVGARYGVEPIVIETDLPERMHPYLGWIEYHGTVLAGIRHLLADRFATMRVAASVDAASMWDVPWGSHPGVCKKCLTTHMTFVVMGNRRAVPCFAEAMPNIDDHALRIPDVSVRTDMLVLRAAAVAAGGFEPLVARIDRVVAEFDGRRTSLAGRFKVRERLRRARHRWRFHHSGRSADRESSRE